MKAGNEGPNPKDLTAERPSPHSFLLRFLRSNGLTILTGLLMSALITALWWGLNLREQAELQKNLTAEASYLTTIVDADLRDRLPALAQLEKRWLLHGGTPRNEFESDANSYVNDMPGYQAIEWVDASLHVRWIVPLAGNESALNLDLGFAHSRRAAVERAVTSMQPTMSAPIDLVQGGKGFLIYYPIRLHGEFDGLIMAVFRIQTWLEYVFSLEATHRKTDDNFRLLITLDNETVMRQNGWTELDHGPEASSATQIMGHDLSIRLRPTPSFLARHNSRLPELMAVLGGLLALLVTMVVYLLQTASHEARTIRVTKLALENEMSERRRAEAERTDALTRMDLATRAGGIGVWAWNSASDKLSWNEQMYRLYGLPTDIEPSYQTWRDAIHPDDLNQTEELLRQATKGKAVFNTEFRIRHANGVVRYLGAAARMERDQQGLPLRMNGINWDITERRMAEQALKESEEKFRALAQTTATAILVYQDDRWIYANPAAEELCGYSEAELRCMNFWDIMHPDYREAAKERGQKRLNSTAAPTFVLSKIVAKDGREKWIETSAATTLMNGHPAGIISVSDVTKRQQAEAALRQSEERVRLLLDSTAEAIYGVDLDGNCTFANSACLRMTGFQDTNQLLGRNMHDLIHHSYADGRPMPAEDCRIYKAYREGTEMHVDDEVLWKSDGTSFPAEYWSYPQLRDGKVEGAVVTFIDISDRKQMEAAILIEKERLSNIIDGTNVGTWEWNVQTGETVFNERWAGMIGYTLAELEPISIETWTRLVHKEDLVLSIELLEKHFRGEQPYYECEARLRHKNGSWVWVLDRGRVATWTTDGKPLLMSGTHQEITARKLAEEMISHMANHDLLTDLPTLRLAKDRLNVALSTARRNHALAAVLFLDLDGFKAVNDNHGHDIGDCVLREVATRLLGCCREIDTVARIGGDEFLIVVGDLVAADAAATVAKRVIESIAQPFSCGQQTARLGISIGIAIYPDHPGDSDELIKLADTAMYSIKSSGKNGYAFAVAPGA